MEKKNVTHIILVIAVIGVVSGLWYLNSGEQVQYAADTNTRQQESGQETANETVSPEQAQKIMGNENYIGPEDIQNTFGFTPENIPEIPFSQAELIRAKELGQQFVLYINEKEGEDFTLEDAIEAVNNKASDGNPILWDGKEHIQRLQDTTLRSGWRLTSPEITEDTTDKDYLEQTEALISYLQNEIFKNQDLPEHYQVAIDEFKNKKEGLADLLRSDWRSDWEKAVKQLTNLTINQLLRENAPEVIYRLILAERKNGVKHLENIYTWTASISPYGGFVSVGDFYSGGLGIGHWPSDRLARPLGVCLSRGL